MRRAASARPQRCAERPLRGPSDAQSSPCEPPAMRRAAPARPWRCAERLLRGPGDAQSSAARPQRCAGRPLRGVATIQGRCAYEAHKLGKPRMLISILIYMYIVVRLREDRRTPLHFWRSRMCRELLRILAAPARILSERWQFLLHSWLRNGTAFANFNAKKFCKNHSKMVPKPSKSIKNCPKWRPIKTKLPPGPKKI